MGEYAMCGKARIKIGTCEDMYYLRADQAHLVRHQDGNVDPVKDAAELRFRFPFPDEDGVQPGMFEPYERRVNVSGVPIPDDLEHYAVQFTRPGYVVSLPCPESKEAAKLYTAHRNGNPGAVGIVRQRLAGGNLCLILRCEGCGAMWRANTLEEAKPYIDALRAVGGKFHEEMARRAEAGYTEPHLWNSRKAELATA